MSHQRLLYINGWYWTKKVPLPLNCHLIHSSSATWLQTISRQRRWSFLTVCVLGGQSNQIWRVRAEKKNPSGSTNLTLTKQKILRGEAITIFWLFPLFYFSFSLFLHLNLFFYFILIIFTFCPLKYFSNVFIICLFKYVIQTFISTYFANLLMSSNYANDII